MEGTYPLPEAQLDRFFFKLHVGAPGREEMHMILDRTTGAVDPVVQPVLDSSEILEMQALVREVPAGTGVSYGHRYVTGQPTRLALLPLGYADGLPRAGANSAEVSIGARRFRAAGSICMDQFVIDVEDLDVVAGDTAIVFGQDGPSAEEWATACGTIGYEMTTRMGSRLARRFVGGA